MATPPKPAGPAPSRASLQEAALRHLARFAATEAGLVRVLDRRLQRWARLAGGEGREVGAEVAEARVAVRAIARALVESGVVDDAAFAAARARRLLRAGRSRRAASAHLAAKGVASGVVEAAVMAGGDELPSALAYARRRRIGPFRVSADAESRMRDMAALARAGFPRDVVERALATGPDAAAALVAALKRG